MLADTAWFKKAYFGVTRASELLPIDQWNFVSFRQICMIFFDRLAIVITHGNQPNGADDDDSDAVHANWRES